jgi:hypothetical protein
LTAACQISAYEAECFILGGVIYGLKKKAQQSSVIFYLWCILQDNMCSNNSGTKDSLL